MKQQQQQQQQQHTSKTRTKLRTKLRSPITKRGLDLRKTHRLSQAGRTAAQRTAAQRTQRTAVSTATSDNYAQRVLSGQFEPTSVKARAIADARGQSLHSLAHDLGYADAPPRVRIKVQLSSLSRAQLSAATGYDKTDLSRLFARKHPPTLSKLARIAAAYGAWLDDVLTALGW